MFRKPVIQECEICVMLLSEVEKNLRKGKKVHPRVIATIQVHLSSHTPYKECSC